MSRSKNRGEANARWNGGSYIASDGYRYVRVTCDHGRTRYRLEHRVVMESALGRRLRRSEHVHHRNGEKADNRPENLELLSVSAHRLLHDAQISAAVRAARAQQATCKHGHPWSPENTRHCPHGRRALRA